MPTIEAVQNPLAAAKPTEKPIPSRTVNTRPQRLAPEIAGQPLTSASPDAESSTPEESVRLSPQLTALAKKEQAYRQKEQALKEREKELEAQLLEAKKFAELKEKMSTKDFSEAEALGLNYDEYTQYKLDQAGEKDPRDEKIRALEERFAAQEKRAQEDAAALYEDTIGEYKSEIAKLVSANADFSTINGVEGGQQAVMQFILDSFEEDGTEYSVEDACKIVEAELEERGKKWTSLPKFKREISEAPVPQKTLPRPVVGKTLTNDMTVSSETRPLKSLQHLSENERYAEARRRAEERLKRQGL